LLEWLGLRRTTVFVTLPLPEMLVEIDALAVLEN
jgi:hypothetical protein